MLTIIESLENCIEMWEWLRVNPDKDKEDYFKSKNIDKSDIPIYRCYACQYAAEQANADMNLLERRGILDSVCKFCPFKNWSKQFRTEACEDSLSYFADWIEAINDEEHACYAGQIVDLAKKFLEEARVSYVFLQSFKIQSFEDAQTFLDKLPVGKWRYIIDDGEILEKSIIVDKFKDNTYKVNLKVGDIYIPSDPETLYLPPHNLIYKYRKYINKNPLLK